MLKGLFGGKKPSTEKQGAPATQDSEQAAFKILTLNDLPKLSVATLAPAQPAVVPKIATRQLVLSDGPRRSVPEDSYVVPEAPDKRKSYAASIVSPSTPKAGRFDFLRSKSDRRRDDEIPPMPSRGKSPINPFRTCEEEERGSPYDDLKTPYDNVSVFNFYSGESSTTNPYNIQRGPSNRSRPETYAPERLKTDMLNLEGWSPSTSVSSNPFGNSPQDERYVPGYSRDVSPISDARAVSQDIRYSDCGVNPFQGLDDAARKERESSNGVGDIWDMIVGKTKEEARKPPPSPRIRIDTSALDPQYSTGPATREPTRLQIPDSAGSASPSPVSPCEWYKDILHHYAGRPSEINRAMSYMPTPTSPHPPGLSPMEITSMAVPYLADIEIELAELQKNKTNPEAEVLAQQERDRVRDLIQRQLAHEQAIEALERATGGKRMTKEQLEPAKIWSEIDLSSVKRDTVRSPNGGLEVQGATNDRDSAMTVWPSFAAENVPPVPKIPEQHLMTESKDSKPTKLQKKPSIRLFGWGSRSKNTQAQPLARDLQEIPITALNISPKAAKVLSVDSVNTPAPILSQLVTPQRDSGTFSEHFAPSKQDGLEGSNYSAIINEKEPPRIHIRNESTNTFSAPPPYSKGMAADPTSSRRSSRLLQGPGIPKGIARAQRFPVKASDLPKLTTDSSGPPHRLDRAATFSDMQFTPTTPNHARTYPANKQQHRNGPAQIGLGDIGFRSNMPADQRAKAEKKRQRQETRERLFRRGGSLWLCGLCCGVRKMTKRMKIFWWSFFIILIIIAAAVGTVTSIKNNKQAPPPAPAPVNLVTLANLPPMPVDNVTITPRLVNSVNTCVAPSTMWSCQLPPPLAAGVNPAQPIFSWRIFALNSSTAIVNPSPILPLADDYRNFSKIDGVSSSPPEGEATNFYISLLPSNTTDGPSNALQLPSKQKRSHSRHFPRQVTATSTATPVQLEALPQATVLPNHYTSQQLRFFDRGLPSEHFKFMTFFQKTIYLRTIDADTSNAGTNKLDADGGVSPSEARFVCNWPQTRYITKIYTRPNATDSTGQKKLIVDPNTIGLVRGANAGGFAGYAVEIEEDIANYDKVRPTVSCWAIDERGKIDPNNMQRRLLVQGIGTGTSGVDYRGCQCTWSNFKESTGQGL
ncbi:hypothetical protein Dda_1888 [Drechslerella dactyloides]|uniref:Glycoprotease family protein n=1 Tax=Drechslerella dactyloides TaxID=74499 RepID=A0AAD6J4V4_DREDA|nr:hypothetical protein Dda_1888 [Drechslerella dactyloides]